LPLKFARFGIILRVMSLAETAERWSPLVHAAIYPDAFKQPAALITAQRS